MMTTTMNIDEVYYQMFYYLISSSSLSLSLLVNEPRFGFIAWVYHMLTMINLVGFVLVWVYFLFILFSNKRRNERE